jgi:maleylpyruvate isomerase
MVMKLHNFFRSGTSHRLRIALNLKGLTAEYVAVDLRKEQHLSAAFQTLNPQMLVPVLEVAEGENDVLLLTQSPAIIEWLEERYPEPALLPKDLAARAHVRALAAVVGCDIHPVNNRRILEYLRHELHQDEPAILKWCGQWISAGFDAYDGLLQRHGLNGPYSWGDTPTLADAYLVPQIESARRFGVDLSRWPRLVAVDAACAQLPAFQRAAPAVQSDGAG